MSTSTPRLLEVIDMVKAALVRRGNTMTDPTWTSHVRNQRKASGTAVRPFKNIKSSVCRDGDSGRASDHGDVEHWNNKVVFQVRVKETGKLAISNAAIDLLPRSGNPSL
ncbi:hypothetical protein ASPSYDRAFT_37625 [Aspergillus sydowii CBS 593.65]|uniref:Uncharacterized protein n=1 Tax=Aspergillus sydowii CBS 593.65 TaxID=1036612 RepID=A0A1L9SY44_9EURO|nr:uncharacterized protein ASPSYDRAFT_37625 [Aspergillus sydowii CBS 593.65]OJJ52108.1 hypothetical protein ASPSYDRAFT_37625 [Aspergillus sydowii CBS 593.65]